MTNAETMTKSTLALLRQENRRNAGAMVMLPRRDDQGPESALFCGQCQRWSPSCAVSMCRKAQDRAVMENRDGKGWVPMVPAEVGRGLPEVEAL